VRHITKEALNKSLLGALPVKSGWPDRRRCRQSPGANHL